jgi:23S rRNA pseudouridine955/2504/2580 synthase/23S rRNA pseudouridine1911/1915/1917 synthase
MKKLSLFNLRSHHVEILAEDDDYIAFNKPSGLLVLPDRYDTGIPNIVSLLRAGGDDAYVVHRLDKDTSGVIILAKTKESHSFLNDEFEKRSVTKQYIAICLGEVREEEGTINLALRLNPATRTMRVNQKKGKESRTSFMVKERFRGFTSLDIQPLTGRTHQIRVHLSAIGHPLLSDPAYGDGRPFFLSKTKKTYTKGKKAEKPLLSRTALHAEHLQVRHPRTRELVTLTAPLPKDMRSVIRMLRKYAPPSSA